MRTLLFSACILGCLTTSQAFAADRIVVPYSTADLASDAALGALYGKITAAAMKLCRSDTILLRAEGNTVTGECERESVRKAIVATKQPALVAYDHSVRRGENAATRRETLASR